MSVSLRGNADQAHLPCGMYAVVAVQGCTGPQAIDDAIGYYTTHRARMEYAAYRSRRLPTRLEAAGLRKLASSARSSHPSVAGNWRASW